MRPRTLLLLLAWLLLGGALLLGLFALGRRRPQDLPWTRLDLAAPIGLFTGRKLTALGGDPALCRALLARAGLADRAAPPLHGPGQCGYADGERLLPGGAGTIAYRPAGLTTRCAVAAGLAVWEWEVVQPAAIRLFGQTVRRVDHFGSYNCRRIAGVDRGWSEHATGNAVDVAGFELADGRRISVARDWARTRSPEAAFLRATRDGACRLFATVLSPDYNAAHHDHLHLDQAARGAAGWRACR
ncbi:extensin-like domain-containing protein [Sphingomonas morindae]|uniref:Extensin family protein n=1 Tax=Sphingomonas morindae TaxID=1541170 RepID=A0ABY4X3E7_9SPHN|nr:extensin family protein [Sphingomonas morindae]USI71412.1 extensin family protein [Sphingomonas morindae]